MAHTNDQDLMEFVSSLSGGDGLRVEETLGNGFVRLRVSEAERRQAKHDIRCVEDALIELLRNARDASAQHIFVATFKEGTVRTIIIVDDGSGIPPEMHARVFDARVTTKLDTMNMDKWGVHGRGMALFSIAQNALSARVIASDVGLGTCIGVTFDTKDITERADQSTWPAVTRNKNAYEVRGPRNLLRTCVEFGIEAQDRCKVYIGSASEIVATMRHRIPATAQALELRAKGLERDTQLVMRPALAQDARTLANTAASLGMHMSERNAHRIIRNEIKPVQNARVHVLGHPQTPKTADDFNQTRQLNLSPSDKQELLGLLSEDFEEVVRRYYFELSGVPRIRIEKGSVHIIFDYADEV